MPDLLLELRSEEIPARMQRKAAGDLKKLVTDGLVEAGLTYEAAREYWTPRRLALDIRGLTARSKDVRDEIRGPSTKAPEQAVQGFLRKAGLTSVAEAKIQSDPKKGDFYVAHIVKPGRAAQDVIAELMPSVIRGFPWPKSMRWGAASGPKGLSYGGVEGRGGEALRWVRPLQSIVCTFGPETENPVVVDFEIDGIRAGNVTYGHRFHAPGPIAVRRFEDYAAKLEAAKVVIDAERRKEIILADARNLAFANGLDLVEDDNLLEEVSGLVEWPVVLMGEFEADFLAIPAEVIRLTIRANQKCFVMRPQGEAENLSNRFIVTANIEARDDGAEIARGNGKVVRARLSDALYFWKTDQADLPDLDTLKASAEKFGLDLKKPLDQRMARLDRLGVTFHAKLGTQGERVERIRRLAEELAPMVEKAISPLEGEMGGSPEGGAPSTISRTPPSALPGISPSRGEISQLAARAAVLAKADLQTEAVGEFPELQGLMGRKYALLQDEHPSVAAAIEEHYKPQGPSDRVPTDPVSIAVALADKLDTLVDFWAIDEKPTGSKDPYALRRAALGVIRIVVENGVRLELTNIFDIAYLLHLWEYQSRGDFALVLRSDHWRASASTRFLRESSHQGPQFDRQASIIVVPHGHDSEGRFINHEVVEGSSAEGDTISSLNELGSDLLAFFHDRLKVYLRDQGARHDLIDAVLASGSTISPSGREISQSPTAEGRKPDRASAGQAALAEASERSERTAVSGINDDLLTIVRRVEALGSFLDTEDGKNLLAGTKRAANILAAEEKKGTAIAAAVDPALLRDPTEKTLFAAVNQAEKEAGEAIQKEDFSAAMRALSALREPVDSFFEKVLVNDEDTAVRANRLALLSRIRAATGQVADFSKIAG